MRLVIAGAADAMRMQSVRYGLVARLGADAFFDTPEAAAGAYASRPTPSGRAAAG